MWARMRSVRRQETEWLDEMATAPKYLLGLPNPMDTHDIDGTCPRCLGPMNTTRPLENHYCDTSETDCCICAKCVMKGLYRMAFALHGTSNQMQSSYGYNRPGHAAREAAHGKAIEKTGLDVQGKSGPKPIKLLTQPTAEVE